MILVTIIIPVYNMELYLKKCMDSVFAQSYKNLQIILVDDGSKDNSSVLCDAYQQKDNRVEVIHKTNGGLGFARNSGMEQAKGEYIFFLDADDWLPENSIENLIMIAKDHSYDVIRGVYYIKKMNSVTVTKCCFTEGIVKRGGSKEESERYRKIKTSSIFGYACGAFYSRKFLLKHQLMFDDNRVIFLEDTLFNLKVFAHNPEYYIICQPVYGYLLRNGSLSHAPQSEDTERLLLLIKTYSHYLNERGIYKDNLDLLVPLIARHFCFAVANRLNLSEHRYKEIKKVIRTYGMNEEIGSLLIQKRMIRYLVTISSKAQIVFYSFCLFFLKHKAYRFLAMTFVVLSPFLNQYINSNLKV